MHEPNTYLYVSLSYVKNAMLISLKVPTFVKASWCGYDSTNHQL